MAEPLNLVWWTLPVELSFYLILPLLGVISRAVDWRVMLLAALLITLSWRSWVFLIATSIPIDDTAGMDSLIGVLFTFMLGFSMNFLPTAFDSGEAPHILVRRLLLLALMQWQLS